MLRNEICAWAKLGCIGVIYRTLSNEISRNLSVLHHYTFYYTLFTADNSVTLCVMYYTTETVLHSVLQCVFLRGAWWCE